jgi:prepilin-type N-terminal cleavage/methylation domain-containing protein
MLNVKTSNKRTSNSGAFTLIELSIVLIIIGLLVAGVVGGAGLIKSSQLRGVMSEVGGYRVAVNTFQNQFDQLPGDYDKDLGVAQSEAGDADKKITFADSAETAGPGVIEGVNAWYHLIGAKILNGDEVGLTYLDLAPISVAPALTIGTHIPDSRISGLGWVFDHTTVNTVASNVLIATSDILVTVAIAADANALATGTLTPSDALAIDEKMDDGVANDGDVRASVATAACNTTATSYTTSDDDKECALEFTIGS